VSGWKFIANHHRSGRIKRRGTLALQSAGRKRRIHKKPVDPGSARTMLNGFLCRTRRLDQAIDHGAHGGVVVVAFGSCQFVGLALPVGTGAAFHDGSQVAHFRFAAGLGGVIARQIEKFVNKFRHGDKFPLPKSIIGSSMP